MYGGLLEAHSLLFQPPSKLRQLGFRKVGLAMNTMYTSTQLSPTWTTDLSTLMNISLSWCKMKPANIQQVIGHIFQLCALVLQLLTKLSNESLLTSAIQSKDNNPLQLNDNPLFTFGIHI